MQTQGTSATMMFSHIGERNIKTMLTGTAVALLLISVILMFALKSFKIGLISLVPNLVPPLVGFGIWGLVSGQVGLGLSVVAGMTLGIVVDDTVHFLSKYTRAMREKKMSPEDSVRYAFHNVGQALVVTTLVLMAGFFVLATSDFLINSNMGLLTGIVIGLALIADFLLLPTLLMKLGAEKR
jgi:predicted RND superfamily exporter protein